MTFLSTLLAFFLPQTVHVLFYPQLRTQNQAEGKHKGMNFTTTLFFVANIPFIFEPCTLNSAPSSVSIRTSYIYQIPNISMSCTLPVQAAKNATSGNGTRNNSGPWDPCYQPSASTSVHFVYPGAHSSILLACMFYIQVLVPCTHLAEVVLTAEFDQQIMISIKPEGRL